MLTGTVSFVAKITNNRVAFPPFEFTPSRHSEIEKIGLECSDGEVRAIIHFAAVATVDDAERLGAPAVEAVLDHLAFQYNLAIDKARRTTFALRQRDAAPGMPQLLGVEAVAVGGKLTVAIGLGTADLAGLKATFERSTPSPGEQWSGLFRLALGATSPVEKFLMLYHVLQALIPDSRGEDSQAAVDAFIRAEEPGVSQTLGNELEDTARHHSRRAAGIVAHRRTLRTVARSNLKRRGR